MRRPLFCIPDYTFVIASESVTPAGPSRPAGRTDGRRRWATSPCGLLSACMARPHHTRAPGRAAGPPAPGPVSGLGWAQGCTHAARAYTHTHTAGRCISGTTGRQRTRRPASQQWPSGRRPSGRRPLRGRTCARTPRTMPGEDSPSGRQDPRAAKSDPRAAKSDAKSDPRAARPCGPPAPRRLLRADSA